MPQHDEFPNSQDGLMDLVGDLQKVELSQDDVAERLNVAREIYNMANRASLGSRTEVVAGSDSDKGRDFNAHYTIDKH